MRKKILVSTSGGRTSGFMAKFINEHKAYDDWSKLFVFANTGKEKEETLVFLDNLEKKMGIPIFWVEMKIKSVKPLQIGYEMVTFETADRTGRIFEDAMKLRGLPSWRFRFCTDLMKKRTIEAFARDFFGTTKYRTALGIRADEKHRVKDDSKIVYPLVDLNITKDFIRNWWDKQEFDLQLKDYQGNCDFCFLKSLRNRKTMVLENPESAEWWAEMEEKYGTEDFPIMDFRNKKSMRDVIQESQEAFKLQKDKHVPKTGRELFEFDDDISFDCFCSTY